MNRHARKVIASSIAIGLIALSAGRTAAADEVVVERPKLLLVVEIDKESLRIDVPVALRAIEASLTEALAGAAAAEVQMAAIDTPPRG